MPEQFTKKIEPTTILDKASLPDITSALVQRTEMQMGLEQSSINAINQNTLYVEAESPYSDRELLDKAREKITSASEKDLERVVFVAHQALIRTEKHATVKDQLVSSSPLGLVGIEALQKKEELATKRIIGETITLALQNNIPGLS